MELLHTLWKDVLGLLGTPLLTIGNTPFTVLRLGGLVLILLLAWRVSAFTKRASMRLAREDASPGAYLMGRISVYVVWIVFAIAALRYLGAELSTFAFLGGAFGVGIGFGLQNVLNNFVSGMIIILERTLRVGDIVELQSGVTGRVSEINLRYTRITTGDKMDVLVPNSEFISSRVSSWTHGAGIRRLHVPFTVALNADKDLVREAGLAAAQNVAGNLDADAREPEVLLSAIGKESLNFELVVWIGVHTLDHPAAARNHYLWALETELRKRAIQPA